MEKSIINFHVDYLTISLTPCNTPGNFRQWGNSDDEKRQLVTSEIFPIREDAKSREGAELLMTRGAVVNKKKVVSSSSTVDKEISE